MSVSADFTSCTQCGTRIEEAHDMPIKARALCPTCGSTTRNFNVHIQEALTLGEKIFLKHKRPGHKKPIFEYVSGNDLHRNSGQWNHLTREIDRENDRYKELIINPKTGEVIRNVDEPLTEHTDRGSAKPKIEGPEGEA